MKKNEFPKLSPYKIWWVIVTPYKGYVRKSDIKRLGGTPYVSLHLHHERFYSPFPSREKALAFVSANHNLSKPYQARLLTDKQFGDIQVEYLPNGATFWDIPYTSKQAAEVFVMQ